jgi:hypothetical protein
MRQLDLPSECQLVGNLIKSSTDIGVELDYLSRWFVLNTTSSASLLSMGTILDASLNLTNRINPTFNLRPHIEIKQELVGYSNLIFVFNILLMNVIEHSKLSSNDLKLTIESDVDANQTHVFIKFTHNLNSNADFSANVKKLNLVKENWNNHENIDRSNKEGESGYDKIKRILIYEVMAKSDLFDFELVDNSISVTLYFPYTHRSSNA